MNNDECDLRVVTPDFEPTEEDWASYGLYLDEREAAADAFPALQTQAENLVVALRQAELTLQIGAHGTDYRSESCGRGLERIRSVILNAEAAGLGTGTVSKSTREG